MKVLRICEQGVFDNLAFNSLEELRDYLRELHSYGVSCDEDAESINNLSLDELCDVFEWSYQIVSDEEAEPYTNNI